MVGGGGVCVYLCVYLCVCVNEYAVCVSEEDAVCVRVCVPV